MQKVGGTGIENQDFHEDFLGASKLFQDLLEARELPKLSLLLLDGHLNHPRLVNDPRRPGEKFGIRYNLKDYIFRFETVFENVILPVSLLDNANDPGLIPLHLLNVLAVGRGLLPGWN